MNATDSTTEEFANGMTSAAGGAVTAEASVDQVGNSDELASSDTAEPEASDRPVVIDKEEVAAIREELLDGVPFFNIGAMFMPPIWGPAHGIWATIIFYPLWAIADSCLYAAYSSPTPLSVVAAILLFAAGAAGTLVFAHTAQLQGLLRAYEKGHDKEWYLKRQRVWAIWMVLIAVVLIVAATYYNLAIKPSFA